MPHIVLDSRANDRFGQSLPVTFPDAVQYSMGEPFDQQWRLLGPRGYGADIYQIITPDVLEALSSGGIRFDLEIVDHWLFLYDERAWVGDPQLWAQIDRVWGSVATRLAPKLYHDRRSEGGGLVICADRPQIAVQQPGASLGKTSRAKRRNTIQGVAVAIATWTVLLLLW